MVVVGHLHERRVLGCKLRDGSNEETTKSKRVCRVQISNNRKGEVVDVFSESRFG